MIVDCKKYASIHSGVIIFILVMHRHDKCVLDLNL